MKAGEHSPHLSQTLQQQSGTVVAVPRLRIFIEREGGKTVEQQLDLEGNRIRIGSHSSNEVVLTDRLVSRFHCTLSLDPGGWCITDTGSLNGTFVSNVRVREAILPTMDCEIRLGDSKLRVTALSAKTVETVRDEMQFGELYGRSLVMRQLFGMLERVAVSDTTILVEGESGTGKELVAREIVRRGPRSHKPFQIVDCSAIAPNLIESELFGHVRGAFTGADRARAGAFEGAQGGTVFLDEIGEMPLEMQPKLLRALEAREIRRVGENEARKIDVRVIAATNRNLEREVNQGRFREDLYFRLSVIGLRLPPLRERLEDLPILINAFLESMDAAHAGPLFTPELLQRLATHGWPGNVRELRNYVERVVVLEDPNFASVPSQRRLATAPQNGEPQSGTAINIEEPFKVAKERLVTDFERAYLERLMAWADGNVSRAARKAKIDRMYLHRLLSRFLMTRNGELEE